MPNEVTPKTPRRMKGNASAYDSWCVSNYHLLEHAENENCAHAEPRCEPVEPAAPAVDMSRICIHLARPHECNICNNRFSPPPSGPPDPGKEAPPQALKRLLILEGLIGEAHEAIAQIGWENTHSTKPSRWMLAAEKYFHDFPAVVSQDLAAAEPAPSPLTREAATTIECPSGYHQVFVRGDGTIVAHYDDNGGRCCASECKVSPRPDETSKQRIEPFYNYETGYVEDVTQFPPDALTRERAHMLRLSDALEAIVESASDGRAVPEWLVERLVAARAALRGETE